MTTSIQNVYKKTNETCDRSGDYKVIKMPEETYTILKCALRDARRNAYDKKRAQRLLEILDEAEMKSKSVFY